MPKCLAALAAVLLAALVAAPVSAAPRFHDCNGEIPGQCTTVTVPLDRSGALPGTVKLAVRRTLTGTQPKKRAVLAIAGGPGQSAILAYSNESYLTVLTPILAGRDYLAIDARGTGSSGALRCPGFQGARREQRTAEAAKCAQRIGPKRSVYTTRDNVEDIEAVRKALGLTKLTPYGVSYGTKVALAYAAAYPDHVDRILLDSVLPLDGPDPLYRPTFTALRRVIPALCAHNACRGITSHPLRDLEQLTARLHAHPLRGTVYDSRGRAHAESVDEVGFFDFVFQGDELPMLRSELPSAVRSALRGDNAPLLRLDHPDVVSGNAAPLPFSDAVFAATSCEEMDFPWSRTAPLVDRPAQLQAALAAQPAGTFSPFSAALVPHADFPNDCLRWPVRPQAPALTIRHFPNVPALLLEGEDDTRTPVEEARRVEAQLPQAKLLTVEATAHSVSTAGVPCVDRALARWARGQSIPPRCRRTRPDPITPLLPRTLADVSPAPGTSGRPGKTLGAAMLTIGDLFAQFLGGSGGGLRGGSFRTTGAGDLVACRVVLARGVTLSGTLRAGARLTVGGTEAARGTLTLHRDGTLTGFLGGHKVHGRLPPVTRRHIM